MTAPVPDHAALPAEELRRRIRTTYANEWLQRQCALGLHAWVRDPRSVAPYCGRCGKPKEST